MGGRVSRIDLVNFSVIVSRKEIQALSFALFFNFEDSKPGPISGEKKVFDTEPSRKGGHWVREGVADRSGHWTRVDQGQSTSL